MGKKESRLPGIAANIRVFEFYETGYWYFELETEELL